MPRGTAQRAQKILDRVNPRVEPGFVLGLAVVMFLLGPWNSDRLPPLLLYKLAGLIVAVIWIFTALRDRNIDKFSWRSLGTSLLMCTGLLATGATLLWLTSNKPTPWLHELAYICFGMLTCGAVMFIVMLIAARFPRKPSTPAKTTSFTLSKTPAHTFRLTREA